MIGRVKWFDPQRGYGFIEPEANGIPVRQRDIFVHYSGICGDGYRKLQEGDRVEFDVEQTGKGPQAVEVEVIRG